MVRSLRRALGVVLVGATAHAAGIYIGETGSKTLLQGGAFAGEADDLTAIHHNPGGLTQLPGFSFLVDLGAVKHDVTFQRAGTPAPNQVANSDGPSVLPFAAVGYGFDLLNRPLTLSLGVYAPPAPARYTWPVPNYDKVNGSYVESPKKFAPQRYAQIESDSLIVYPTLSAAYAFHPRFSVGVSAQAVISKFKLSQSISSALITPQSMRDEDPDFDSVVSIDLNGRPGFTGILGLFARPIDDLGIGASVRPPVPIHATGNLSFKLGAIATQLGTTVTPDQPQADLDMTLPLEVRVGAYYRPISRLGVVFDFVYEKWSSMQELTLTPRDVNIQLGSAPPEKVEPFRIPKNFRDTYSARLGAGFDLHRLLTLHAGVLYETQASPDEKVNIDFAHFARMMVSAGASVHLSDFDLVLGGAWFPTVTKEITNSEVRAGSTFKDVEGGVIGNGVYTSGGWIMTFGVRGTFGRKPAPTSPSTAPAGKEITI